MDQMYDHSNIKNIYKQETLLWAQSYVLMLFYA